ncbi:PA domain-containing protein [Psidium guajava]|nr:PA domain-containing protein [Psidium guajava]
MCSEKFENEYGLLNMFNSNARLSDASSYLVQKRLGGRNQKNNNLFKQNPSI